MQAVDSYRSSAKYREWMLEKIASSDLFEEYKSSFQRATGLALYLVSAEGETLTGQAQEQPNKFCALLHQNHDLCHECCLMRRKMAAFGDSKIRHFTCFAGLCESCVAIRAGTNTIGLLIAGQSVTKRPSQAKFERVATHLKQAGGDIDQAELRRAYFSSPILKRERYESFMNLLEVFAGHLSLLAHQITLHEADAVGPDIRKALDFIHSHLGEELALKDVARRANLSECYFSTKFRESTGLSFTHYVATARVEEAKKLLVSPCIRISEIAYEVGFQSLTNFNRVFKTIAGFSPTQYRQDCGAVDTPNKVRLSNQA